MASNSSSPSAATTATRLKHRNDPFLRMIRAERSRLLASVQKHSSPDKRRHVPTSPAASVTQSPPAATATATRTAPKSTTTSTAASNFLALTRKYEERLDEMQHELEILRGEKEQQHGVLQTTLQDHANQEQQLKKLQSTLKEETEKRTALEERLQQSGKEYQTQIESLETALAEQAKQAADAQAALASSEAQEEQLEEKAAIEQSLRLEAEDNFEKAEKQLAELKQAADRSDFLDDPNVQVVQREEVERLKEMVANETKLRQQAQAELVELQQRLEDEAAAKFASRPPAINDAQDDAVAHQPEQEVENESRSPLAVPLRDELSQTKTELERLRTYREDDRKQHLEQMDHIHEKLQAVTSQRDSSTAKLEATIQELEQSKEMVEAMACEVRFVLTSFGFHLTSVCVCVFDSLRRFGNNSKQFTGKSHSPATHCSKSPPPKKPLTWMRRKNKKKKTMTKWNTKLPSTTLPITGTRKGRRRLEMSASMPSFKWSDCENTRPTNMNKKKLPLFMGDTRPTPAIVNRP